MIWLTQRTFKELGLYVQHDIIHECVGKIARSTHWLMLNRAINSNFWGYLLKIICISTGQKSTGLYVNSLNLGPLENNKQ